jgi:hypothetical protein
MNLREWLFYTRHQRDPGTIFLQLHIARTLRRKRQSTTARAATVSLFGQVEITGRTLWKREAATVRQTNARHAEPTQVPALQEAAE